MKIAEGITIGTFENCELRVYDDPYVSGYHARMYQTERGFAITDLGSTNGTYVIQIDGITRKVYANIVWLKPGERIKVGRTILPWVVDQ